MTEPKLNQMNREVMAKNNLLLDANECALALIDHQPQMVFGVQSHDRQTVVNNVVALAKGAKLFTVPTILTTVAAESFSGPTLPQIQEVFPDVRPIDRSSLNAWEDDNFRKAIEKTGKKKIIMAGLWTEICLAFPVLSAIAEGYEVYFVADASGGSTVEVHEMAIQRMIQAGARPMTWLQTLCEWQSDWARKETYQPFLDLIKEHAGAYGQGVVYAETMLQNKK